MTGLFSLKEEGAICEKKYAKIAMLGNHNPKIGGNLLGKTAWFQRVFQRGRGLIKASALENDIN